MIRDKEKLIYPELSYDVVGILFDTHNQLGGALKEKHYQRAVAKLLKEKGIAFEEQYMIPVKLGEKEVGKYFFDFLIEDRLILEIKVGRLKKEYFDQLHSYIKTSGKKLGILAIFTENEVKFRRILNIY